MTPFVPYKKEEKIEVVKIFCLAPNCLIPKWNESLRVNLSCCSIFSSRESLFSLFKRVPAQNTLKDDISTLGQWYSSTQLTFQGLGRITQIAWTRKTPHFFWQSTRCWCYESISLLEFLFFCHQWLFLNIYIVLVTAIYEMKFITLVWRRSLY